MAGIQKGMVSIMGLIKAIGGAIRGTVADQWKEYFYCDSLESDVLVTRAFKRTHSKFGTKDKGNDNIISNGSVIAVNEGQCMIIVDQGKVVEICAEAGEFLYDTSSEPSLLYGPLGENIARTFSEIGRRITFAGDTGREQRVYFFNTKEIMGNKYGTTNPVPFRVVDTNIGLDMDISVRCHGEYSYRIADPILFYTNVCGNITQEYTRENIDGQLKSELLTALQPAFAQISAMGIRYSAIPAHTLEVADALNKALFDKWAGLRGIEIVSFGVNTIKASEEDEAVIKDLQRSAVMRDPGMAAAKLTEAQAEAMKSAAANTATGPMFAFAGMNMASQASGINASALYQMQQDNKNAAAGASAPAASTADALINGMASTPQTGTSESWSCSCGTVNTGNFCVECGAKKPAPAQGWTCSCGAVNLGRFCSECGKKKPADAPLYQCDKCGWKPEDPHHPPKFCPECGDPFDDNDIQ